MVLGLCFTTGMRLFAVGDPDQSIYGFNGARQDLLRLLSERNGVETVRLRLNYRCATRIVAASGALLDEDLDYDAAAGAPSGEVFFIPCGGDMRRRHRYSSMSFCPRLLLAIRTSGLGTSRYCTLRPGWATQWFPLYNKLACRSFAQIPMRCIRVPVD